MSIVKSTVECITHNRRPDHLRDIGSAPLDGTVFRGFIRDEGERDGPLIEALVKWRDDRIAGAGWVLAGDPDAFVFEPEGWLPTTVGAA